MGMEGGRKGRGMSRGLPRRRHLCDSDAKSEWLPQQPELARCCSCCCGEPCCLSVLQLVQRAGTRLLPAAAVHRSRLPPPACRTHLLSGDLCRHCSLQIGRQGAQACRKQQGSGRLGPSAGSKAWLGCLPASLPPAAAPTRRTQTLSPGAPHGPWSPSVSSPAGAEPPRAPSCSRVQPCSTRCSCLAAARILAV